MMRHAARNRSRFAYRLLSAFIAFTFSLTSILPPSYAQTIAALNLPAPGMMVTPTPAFVPVLLKGMTIDPENPLQFDFIVDTGNSGLDVGAIHESPLRAESEKLVKYFLASMTIPKDDLWVNLSPYEQDRIIPDELGKTELGRDMLAQDYILKQLTASLMYPEKELGKEFWARVYKLAQEKYGTSEIPVNTFNKVWILPDTATIYEHGQTVYIVEAKLRVMLDSDYLAMTDSRKSSVISRKQESLTTYDLPLTTQIVKEIILPEIEKEVNEGQNFAPLRQIYHSLILAKWYKETIKNSLLSKIYIDQKKIAGVNLDDPTLKDQIYAQYMEAYKKGVFNYIKEDYDRLSNETIPRKYFSGGIDRLTNFSLIKLDKTSNPARVASAKVGKHFALTTRANPQRKGKSKQSSSALVIDEAFQREFLAGVEGDTRTFVMIKPDALERGQKEAVVREIERQGFAVEVGPEIRLTTAQASEFYQVHQDRPFFKDLITFITSGPVIPLFLKANGAVEKFNAVKDEVRKILGVVDTKATSNRIHAADSVEHAVEEAKVVFQAVAAQAGAEGTPSSPLEMDAKVRQSERLLLKAGEAGEAELDVTRQGSETMRKQVDAAMAMTLGLVVELPEGLGEVDMAEELNRVNIVWVKTQPRSPPVEGHSGARRNAIYLIAENQEFLQETPTHLIASVLAEEVIKLRAKQRTLQNNLTWTDELAEGVEEFAKIKTLPLRMNILGLMAKEIPNPEKVKADTFNGKRAEEALARLKPGAFKWFEEAVKDLDGAKEVKGALEEGRLAVMLFAAGEASRLRASLLNARIIDNQTPLKDYRLWNVDLKNMAQKVIGNLELLRKLKVDGEGQLNLLEGKDIDFASVINRLKEIYVTGDIYKEINKINPDRTTVKKLLKSDIQDLSAVIEHFSQVDVQRQVAGAKNLKLGRRHLEALRDGIRLDGSSYEFNADKVIENMPVIITVNLQVMKDVQEDLITNNFYGFTPENVYLVVNDLYPGMVYENGKWMFDRASRVENLTNYNHGFNIINATQKGVGYRYDRTKGRFVLEGMRSVFDMVKTTAETVVVHRINDMMLLDPQLAMDTGMYAVYQHRRAHEGTNVMVDVLNNLSGQKGGLWMTTDDHEEGTGFLLEGLAAKTAKIEGALAILRQWVREKFGLQDIPYNRLYTYFDIEAVEEGLRENGGIIPLSVKDDKPRKGVWSPEIPSGDITIVPGLKVGAVIRGNDTLVDGGILEKPVKYEKDKQRGAIIHDFKQLGNLPETMKIVLHQDGPRSSSPLRDSEKDERDLGGIDMNAIDLEREGVGVDIQFDPAELQEIIDAGIDGFAPVIINISPLPSVLPLLGLEPANKEEEQGEPVNAG